MNTTYIFLVQDSPKIVLYGQGCNLIQIWKINLNNISSFLPTQCNNQLCVCIIFNFRPYILRRYHTVLLTCFVKVSYCYYLLPIFHFPFNDKAITIHVLLSQMFCQSMDCLCFSIFTLTEPTKNIKNEAKNSTQSHDLNLLQIPVTYRLNLFSCPSLKQDVKYAKNKTSLKKIVSWCLFHMFVHFVTVCMYVLCFAGCLYFCVVHYLLYMLILCYQELRSTLNTECFLMCHMHPHNNNNNLQKNSGHFVGNTCHTLPKLKTSVVINDQNIT